MTDIAKEQQDKRIEWVDYAKGLSIILLVAATATLGAEAAPGESSWMNSFIAWTGPFAVPGLFALCGLFLSKHMELSWRSYLDRKVVYFAYFYVLWLTVEFALNSHGLIAEMGLHGAVQHYFAGMADSQGTLWFIHRLVIFFVVAKVVEIIPQLTIWLMAAFFAIISPDTGFALSDDLATRFVYFFTGFVAAPHVFTFADKVARQHLALIAGALCLWALANGFVVFGGYEAVVGVSLALGFAGTAAVIAVAQMLARTDVFKAVSYCGRHWLAIYLASFAFVAAARIALASTGVITDGSTTALIAAAAGVIGPVMLYRMVRKTPADFLFERPALFRLPEKSAAGQGQIIAAE